LKGEELPLFGYLSPAAQAGKRGRSTALTGRFSGENYGLINNSQEQ
jgi:hypothetical protein